jgi:hypothetical protein
VRGDIDALGDDAEDDAIAAVSSPSSLVSSSKVSGGTLARARSADKLSDGRSFAALKEGNNKHERAKVSARR